MLENVDTIFKLLIPICFFYSKRIVSLFTYNNKIFLMIKKVIYIMCSSTILIIAIIKLRIKIIQKNYKLT